MRALFFSPIWNNLIKNYLYTDQVTIWWKESVFKIWLIRFLVKALSDFFSAWTHFISSERIYIYIYILKLNWQIRLQVVIEKIGLQIAHFNKIKGQRFWYLKHCWFQIVTKVIGDKKNQWWNTPITIFLLEGGYFCIGVQEEAVN